MSPNLLQDLKIRSAKKEEPTKPVAKKQFWQEGKPTIKPETIREEASVEDSTASNIGNVEPEPVSTESKYASVYDINDTNVGKGRSRYGLWIVALVSVGFLVFSISFLFTRAKVSINPKIQDISLNENLSAVKDSADENSIPFDLVVLDGVESKTIPPGEEKEVVIPAKGRVIIYNNFSTAPQALAIDTRLEGSNGKIYKTETKLSVPGKNKDGTPGSIEVAIYASEAGAEYNSVPLDFTILGFKGTPKYSKFYARSKGEITGGFKGKSSVLSDSEKAKLTSELKTALEAKLAKRATDQLPAGFVLFGGATTLDTSGDNVTFATKDNITTASLNGTLSGFLFEEKKLTKKIAESVIPKYDGSEIYIPNIQNLKFSLAGGETVSFAEAQNISFNLSGLVTLVWRVDNEKIVADLVGRKKKDFDQVLSQYQNIESAELSLSPFWKMSFPEKNKDIQVLVNYPQ